MEQTIVEEIAASLIREYLNRKSLQDTLSVFEREMPRGSQSVSRRHELHRILGLDNLIIKNKARTTPFRAIIEIICQEYLEQQAATCKERFLPLIENNEPPNRSELLSNGSATKHFGDVVIDEDVEGETILGKGHVGTVKETVELEFSSKYTRGMSTPITSNLDSHSRARKDRKRSAKNRTIEPMNPTAHNGLLEHDAKSSKVDGHNKPEFLKSPRSLSQPQPAKTHNSNQAESIDEVLATATQRDQATKRGRRQRNEPKHLEETSYDPRKSSITLATPVRTPPEKSESQGLFGETLTEIVKHEEQKKEKEEEVLENGNENVDMDTGAESEISLQSLIPPLVAVTKPSKVRIKAIDLSTALALKQLLFGSSHAVFPPEWRRQSFGFCPMNYLQYGLVQKRAGPCGVLTSVQSYVLQDLLFSKNAVGLSPSSHRCSEALVKALAAILWKAGDKTSATIAIPGGKGHFQAEPRTKEDGLTETLNLNIAESLEDVETLLRLHITLFQHDASPGVILLLYSAILSRGIQQVREDMDMPTNTLMAANSFCSLELVNLLLTGRAVSNLHNDVIEMDDHGMLLRGVCGRQQVGLLALLDKNGCEVGSYYKTPQLPIWVVNLENHYSILFCLRRDLTSDWKAERRFDLLYYCGLKRQKQQIKLSIDTTNRQYKPPEEDDLVPPLEKCIRTKWPGAEIDWNGATPFVQ